MRVRFPKVKLAFVLTGVLLAIAPDTSGQVTGRLYLKKESYVVGEPLFFTLEIKNASGETIQLYPAALGQRSGSFSFSMQRADGESPGPSCGTTWNLPEKSADPYEVKAGSTYDVPMALGFLVPDTGQG